MKLSLFSPLIGCGERDDDDFFCGVAENATVRDNNEDDNNNIEIQFLKFNTIIFDVVGPEMINASYIGSTFFLSFE